MHGQRPTGFFYEDLEIGMEASLETTVSEGDIVAFAGISGDRNPVHLEEAYAATTPFRQRISHGMLTASYISAVFGMKLPGPGAIYVSQTLNFRRPVFIGDRIVTVCRLVELWPTKRRARFDCVCANGDEKSVLEGEAILMVPSRSA
ncbi:MAG: MaoC family dehydratase [Hyphomicrobiaceae bacterium]